MEATTTPTAAEFAAKLTEALDLAVFNGDDDYIGALVREAVAGARVAVDYEQGGYLTHDEGLVVRFDGGYELQVTVKQVRR